MHRYSHDAMATHFQLMFEHEDELIANGIARAIFADIDRLETELSRFVTHSDISRINRAEPGIPVTVEAACLDCLSFGKSVWEQTGGAFDVTIGPLYRALRHPDGTPKSVTKTERAAAAACVGFQHLEIDVEQLTVTKKVAGMSLDLGAIGKGYALDQAAFNLQEHEVTSALLNAGDSTVLGIGSMKDREGWLVRAGQGNPVVLRDNALSGTGFQYQGAHIMDPRTNRVVSTERQIRWAIAPNATLADALSTAFMVMNKKEIEAFTGKNLEIQAIFVA